MRRALILAATAALASGCYVHSRSPGPASSGQPQQVDYVEHQGQPTYGGQAPAQQGQPQPWAQQVAPAQGQQAQPAPAPAPSQPPPRPQATYVGQSSPAIDLQATQGNFDGARLEPGFTPDPARLEGVAGGSVDASTVSGGCTGWIAQRPDHVVELRGGFRFLRMYVESRSDTTLVVRTPSGRMLCDDDTYDLQPAVEQRRWEDGRYLVWVGSYEQGGSGQYALRLTELAGSTPATSGGGSGGSAPTATAPSSGSSATSSGGAYRLCDIFNGQVGHCGSWYQGEAVLYHDGAYRLCDVFNGQISHCGSWYRGEAPVHHDGAWRTCDIFNGQISHCGSWYRGQAVVRR